MFFIILAPAFKIPDGAPALIKSTSEQRDGEKHFLHAPFYEKIRAFEVDLLPNPLFCELFGSFMKTRFFASCAVSS